MGRRERKEGAGEGCIICMMVGRRRRKRGIGFAFMVL